MRFPNELKGGGACAVVGQAVCQPSPVLVQPCCPCPAERSCRRRRPRSGSIGRGRWRGPRSCTPTSAPACARPTRCPWTWPGARRQLLLFLMHLLLQLLSSAHAAAHSRLPRLPLCATHSPSRAPTHSPASLQRPAERHPLRPPLPLARGARPRAVGGGVRGLPSGEAPLTFRGLWGARQGQASRGRSAAAAAAA